MQYPLTDRCKNMITGALVADAAAMGLHWIYDQDHIRKIAPEEPEFRTPMAADYDGVMAFFAHPKRVAGAQSQYGEQTMVMLRALAANGGTYDEAIYAEHFRSHFGYGGAYVGYIDHATRDTLDNFRRYEDAAHAAATALPFDCDAKQLKGLVAKALPLLVRYTGTELNKRFMQSLRDANSDAATLAFAPRLIDALGTVPRPAGAHDLQLPAIAKLPALVAMLCAQEAAQGAVFDTATASAVRVTSDHAVAASYGAISARMMAAAVTQGSAKAAVQAGLADATGDARTLLTKALDMHDMDNAAVTKHFGMACDLPYGVPSAVHNIATATSFSDAIRRNIYGGGDTCGRAILVGAVMGAAHGIGGDHGIPHQWIDQLAVMPEATQIMDSLFS
ncbi:ADP-ribosylglycohydrolase family protein [uncultured Sulfitobacter sp.]|uniref:ADP-ribosylglycohydrolase family protein n=1 Tax=uncultured Sulfitobacter sp. TaxID=191468 RepID=UPI002621135B|nr:ADP-ribosylglycohydrolase family protein [uncultured Sulfitobacter sp.]